VLGILLGLGASLCWGVSDFVGGLQSRRSPQLGVMVIGATIAFITLLVIAAIGGGPIPESKYLLVGAAGGVSVTIALVAFYRGLAIGMMNVVAPIAATGVILPVIVGIVDGDKPGPVRLVGAVIAIVGVVLVSRQENDGSPASAAMGLSVVLALVAALGFGGEFVALSYSSKGDPLWGAVIAVGTYLLLLIIATGVALSRGADLKPNAGAWPWLLALGLFFAGANALYAGGTVHGDLSAVAVAASLYPAITVLLARGVLGERVRRIQDVGIVAAVVGIVMIAAG
jgi:drug/metabolite transporter (DMT)-like permease